MIKHSLDKYTYSLAVEELRIRGRNIKDPISLSKNSLYYVQIIYYNPGCTISQIAKLIGVSRSAVTMKISALEKEGLVYKKTSKKDKRSHYIYCTKKLISINEQLVNVKKDIYEKIKDKYSENDIKVFCEILDDLSNSILLINKNNYELSIGE